MDKRTKKSKVKVLTDQEVQNLFKKFAVPLFRVANSPTRKETAYELAQMLWLALITGPEIEEIVFQAIERIGKVDSENIRLIRDRYYREMKSAIIEEDLRALRAHYKVKKK